MTVPESERGGRRMCSIVTRAAGEDPIGSAASFDRLLLLELPLPWTRVIRDAPRFPAGVEQVLARADAQNRPYRLHGIVPDQEYTDPGLIRLIHLERPAEAMTVFAKDDYAVPPDLVGPIVQALLEAPAELAGFDRYRQDTTHVRDLLVCTHGTRDTCCGTFGYPVYRRLRHDVAPDQARPTRVWRVSHIGGHRFAPTLLDLPDGRCWGHLDDEAVVRLLRRQGELPDLHRHYRGWAAMPSVPEMIAERAAFEQEGWAWTTWAVASTVVSPTDPVPDTTEVCLSYCRDDGAESGHYEVTVEPSGVVTRGIGSCGDEDLSEHRQYHVRRIVRSETSAPLGAVALA